MGPLNSPRDPSQQMEVERLVREAMNTPDTGEEASKTTSPTGASFTPLPTSLAPSKLAQLGAFFNNILQGSPSQKGILERKTVRDLSEARTFIETNAQANAVWQQIRLLHNSQHTKPELCTVYSADGKCQYLTRLEMGVQDLTAYIDSLQLLNLQKHSSILLEPLLSIRVVLEANDELVNKELSSSYFDQIEKIIKNVPPRKLSTVSSLAKEEAEFVIEKLRKARGVSPISDDLPGSFAASAASNISSSGSEDDLPVFSEDRLAASQAATDQELREVKRDLAALKALNADLLRENEGLTREAANYRTEIGELKGTLHETLDDLAKTQAPLLSPTKQKTISSGEIQAKKSLEAAEEANDKLREEVEKMQASLKKLKTTIARLERELSEEKELTVSQSAELAEKTSSHQKIERMQAELTETQQTISNLFQMIEGTCSFAEKPCRVTDSESAAQALMLLVS